MGEPFRGRVGLGFDIPDTIPEEEEIRKALRRMRNGKAPGPSKIRVEHLKDWADAYEAGMAAEVEGTAIPESVQERAMHWSLVVVLIQGIFQEGKVPAAFRNAVLVLIPKTDTKYRGIALLETLYKLCSSVINRRICANVGWDDGVHGFREGRSCTSAIVENKLLAEKIRSEGTVLYEIFLDLTKAYDTVDRERLFLLLSDYGVGPKCLAVLRTTWTGGLLVPKKGGRYGNPLNTGRGVRQGDIISPTLFNIIVDAVLRFERSWGGQGVTRERIPDVRFYADDGMIAGTDAREVQRALDAIIEGFSRMGVRVNRSKTKWMYVAGSTRVNRIQHGAYCNLIKAGQDSYLDRGRQIIGCPVCDKRVQRRCVQRHLLHQHPERLGQHKIDFFSPTPQRASGPRRWTVDTPPVCCPVPLCPYEADTVTALFRHMAARHPEDEVQVEGYPGYYKCPECNQYVKGATPTQRHLRSATCKRGRKRRQAKEAEEALSDALSDLPTFYIEGREVERVESFTYLGRELTTSDNDLQACMRNLAKAKAKWGAISRVLKWDGATVPYRSRIYLIVVATVLLYGSETWVVTDRMKAALESFHHGCARHITRKYITPGWGRRGRGRVLGVSINGRSAATSKSEANYGLPHETQGRFL